MAVTAFMNKGPVMMYFGQEVGEPGKGFSGFGGDDGRTTIFDYWGVPEFQKWVNGGKYDGQALSPDQRKLRNRYIQILQSINAHPSLREGGFYDLHYYNRTNDYQGYSNRVYAFLRHSAMENLLIITNFSEAEESVNVKIPEDAWQKMGLTSAKISVEINGSIQEIERLSTIGYERESQLSLAVPPMDYLILPLKK